MIVGRQAERALVDAALDRIGDGPVALLLEGDAGIGKSAMLQEALDAAAERTYRALTSRLVETEAGLPFAALVDLFDPVWEDVAAALAPPQALALEVALRRADPDPDEPVPDPSTLSVAVLGAIRALAASGPVVVAIDDAQWLDPATARVLRFALRRLAREPVWVVATLRTGGDPADPLDLGRAFPSERVDRIRLGPLDVNALDQLLRDRLGTALSLPVLVRVHAATGGNPHFALEIVRSWPGGVEHVVPADPFPLPEDLRQVELLRIRSVHEEARNLLLVVAASAEPSSALVRVAVGPSYGSALEATFQAGLIEIRQDVLRFTHPLLASAVLSSVSPERLRTLHGRLAELVTDVEAQAKHRAMAAAGTDEGVADLLDVAAAHARARGAPEAAADLAERAALLTPPEAPRDARRRMLDAAEHRFEAGDPAAARAMLERVLPACPSGPDRADVLRRLGWIRYQEEAYGPAASLFQDALLETGDDLALRAKIRRDLAWAGLMFGDLPNAAVNARAALELTEGLGDPTALAEALTAVGLAEAMLGRGVRDDIMRRAFSLEEHAEALGIDPGANRSFGVVLLWVDDLDSARSRLTDLHQRATEQGDESALPFLLYHLSELEGRAGHWDQAERYAQEGITAALQTGQEPLRAGCLYAAALIDAHRGRVDQARARAEEGMAIAERSGAPLLVIHNLSVLGFLELSLGNAATAHRYMGPLAELVLAGKLREPVMARFLPDEIEALATLGEVEQATALVDQLEERGRALDRSWAIATATRCRGLLAGVQGDLDGALVLLEEALREHERLPYPFALGRTLLMTGEVERRAKRKRLARITLERARTIFDDLGAALWSSRAREELARIGGRVARPWDLTETERRTAELAARGQTNREIADALFLSVRTVESNLSRAYHKLGVRSRTELAVHLSEPVTDPAMEP